MKYVLGLESGALLARFARADALLAFDFDGTLAPIVADRAAVAMRRTTSALLVQLCGLFPCAVLSGRSRADVLGRLGDAPLRQVVGNHGAEPCERLVELEAVVAAAHAGLARSLGGHVGVEIEDKGASLAVHYRRSPHRDEAERAIRGAVEALSGAVRVVPGKLVLNVVPLQAPHKGDALVRVMRDEAVDLAVYVGDDVTDEDVFRLDLPDRLLPIRVGRAEASAASHYLRSQLEIDAFLARLVELRRSV